MPNSYYDIDAYLCEEELLPCSTQFDFSFLSHLDPDLLSVSGAKQQDVLPEKSVVKVPIWAMEKWASMGFVNMTLPRQYARKTRERLEADPSDMDLRKKNERYFCTGRRLINMIEYSTKKVARDIAKAGGRVSRRNPQSAALEKLAQEAQNLRKTLLSTYTGARLQNTLDWAISSVDDDVTSYTSKLTEMERRLFQAGAMASLSHSVWKTYGNPCLVPRALPPKPVTPEAKSETAGGHREKRQRTR